MTQIVVYMLFLVNGASSPPPDITQNYVMSAKTTLGSVDLSTGSYGCAGLCTFINGNQGIINSDTNYVSKSSLRVATLPNQGFIFHHGRTSNDVYIFNVAGSDLSAPPIQLPMGTQLSNLQLIEVNACFSDEISAVCPGNSAFYKVVGTLSYPTNAPTIP